MRMPTRAILVVMMRKPIHGIPLLSYMGIGLRMAALWDVEAML